jgi:hypothetical protein
VDNLEKTRVRGQIDRKTDVRIRAAREQQPQERQISPLCRKALLA